MPKPLIELKDVYKVFDVPHEKRDTVKSYFLNPFKRIKKEKFLALSGINLKINKGEFVGLIGRNGSGKSTLLNVIADIYAASKGEVTVRGSLVPFLSLGVGFNPSLTGRENVFLNGTILGMTHKFLRKKFDEIVDFAEIGDFIDLQLKNYSSGMRVRLALAIAVQAKADIYLLDEVLSVGDESFKEKSLLKMQEMLSEGATVIFVSHQMQKIKTMCSRVVLLENSEVAYDGGVDEGVNQFRLKMMDRRGMAKFANSLSTLERKAEREKKDPEYAALDKLVILDSKGKETLKLKEGEKYKINATLTVKKQVKNPWLAFSMTLMNRPKLDLYGIKADRIEKKKLKELNPGDKIEVEFTDIMRLYPETYAVRLYLGNYRKSGEENPLFVNSKQITVGNGDADSWGIVYNDGSYKIRMKKK
ncbi:MAG: ABC transporter ATP-binding protein [Candidatus Dojkabacteria bacterium]